MALRDRMQSPDNKGRFTYRCLPIRTPCDPRLGPKGASDERRARRARHDRSPAAGAVSAAAGEVGKGASDNGLFRLYCYRGPLRTNGTAKRKAVTLRRVFHPQLHCGPAGKRVDFSRGVIQLELTRSPAAGGRSPCARSSTDVLAALPGAAAGAAVDPRRPACLRGRRGPGPARATSGSTTAGITSPAGSSCGAAAWPR